MCVVFPAASPGSKIPHRCNSTKHRIISPKLPTPHPAFSELQNLANEGSEVGREAGPGDALVAVVPSEMKQPEESGRGDDPGGVASPCSASSSSSSSSPPQMHRAATIALSNGNGFYGDQRGGLAALIVMTTAAPAGRGCGEERNTELGSSHLSLTRAGGRLVLSPVPPKQGHALPIKLRLPVSPSGRGHTVTNSPAQPCDWRTAADRHPRDTPAPKPDVAIALAAHVRPRLLPKQPQTGADLRRPCPHAPLSLRLLFPISAFFHVSSAAVSGSVSFSHVSSVVSILPLFRDGEEEYSMSSLVVSFALSDANDSCVAPAVSGVVFRTRFAEFPSVCPALRRQSSSHRIRCSSPARSSPDQSALARHPNNTLP